MTRAELAVSLLMAMSRDIPRANAAAKQGAVAKSEDFVGTELHGKTLGLVGLGQVARQVCNTFVMLL
jgi:phosphoglycerate dehydrogenase-like enzyme